MIEKNVQISNELENSKEFFVFYEVALRLLDLNNYQDSISKSLRILKENLKFKKCEIYIPDDDDLKLFASSDQDIEPQAKEFKEARTLAQKSQERIVIDNNYNDIVFFDKSKNIDMSNIVYIAIPLIHKTEVIGIFSISLYDTQNENINQKITFLEYVTTLFRYAIFSNLEKDYKVGKFQELKQYYEKEFDISYYDMQNCTFVSDSMKNLKNNIIKIAPNDIRVLIKGEVGTEQLSIATMIHKLSHRQNKPFVILKANLLNENEIETELFGNKKLANKAYKDFKMGKLELADGGSLIIENVDKLPLFIQKKLVDILKINEYKSSYLPSSKYNVRIIATTSKDLEQSVLNGTFNGELYTLLNLVTIEIPPLRQRGDDILYFINTMLNKFNNMYSKTISFSDEALESLKNYLYKGNIKELECSIEKLVYFADDDIVTKSDVLLITGMIGDENKQKEYNNILISNKTLEELEIEAISHALKSNDYNQTIAAKKLGITLRQIGYKIKKYNLM
ncbi:sigma-54-dependent Fis family transcriptional regulator [Arcobacter sp. FWKO B]|uniref:sigma-54-dependent Fis family transcriptional regulator n=1 Tax=Arcobacter sp. FWKO B TaxID=2593672 RepID=UPI0018A59ED5|nr:sigma 54-interacting transcriptional regulator [Arcobacter sp. FWKO B]QOG11398.1 sigma-54-dependent Fis family transcriptional regulator [Arcobacter sp. FWKO B]